MPLPSARSRPCTSAAILRSATERGSATASNLFARNLGSALGATLFGVVVNLGLEGSELGGRVTADDLKHLLESSGDLVGTHRALVATLDAAMHSMFIAMLVVAVLTAVAAMFVPDQWFPRPRKSAGPAATR